MLKLFAQAFWRYLPAQIQIAVSSVFSKVFETRISAKFIPIYCMMFNLDGSYLNQFEPENDETYTSYQDFFRRKYKQNPELKSKTIWPCEGYICDWGHFSEKTISSVKGQNIDLNQIFNSEPELTKNHFFTNIFLHNHKLPPRPYPSCW